MPALFARAGRGGPGSPSANPLPSGLAEADRMIRGLCGTPLWRRPLSVGSSGERPPERRALAHSAAESRAAHAFSPGTPLRSNDPPGRSDLIRAALTRIDKLTPHLWLFGTSAIGRTTLLHAIGDRASAQGWAVATRSVDPFVSARVLFDDLLAAIRCSVHRSASPRRTSVTPVDVAAELALHAPAPSLLLIDDLDLLPGPDSQLFVVGVMKALTDVAPHVHVVVTTATQMADRVIGAFRPDIVGPLHIGPLDDAAVRAILVAGFAVAGLSCEQRDLDHLVAASSGLPGLAQSLGARCVSEAEARRCGCVDPTIVRDVIRALFVERKGAVRRGLAQLNSPSQRAALLDAIATARPSDVAPSRACAPMGAPSGGNRPRGDVSVEPCGRRTAPAAASDWPQRQDVVALALRECLSLRRAMLAIEGRNGAAQPDGMEPTP